jgi:hypothetical protein
VIPGYDDAVFHDLDGDCRYCYVDDCFVLLPGNRLSVQGMVMVMSKVIYIGIMLDPLVTMIIMVIAFVMVAIMMVPEKRIMMVIDTVPMMFVSFGSC